MESKHRYTLEKGSTKHRCPECGKKTFVRYEDTKTGNYLPEHYGRCDREVKCSYQLNPYKDGYSKVVWQQESAVHWCNYKKLQAVMPQPLRKKGIAFLPKEVLQQTLQGYERNVFLQNLLGCIDKTELEKVVALYYLGTVCNGYRTGGITFPFIDRTGNVRTIQVKQFDQKNHTTATDFLHSIIEKYKQSRNEPLPEWLQAYKRNELKVSCLFGEHLLNKYPFNPIALVESPKNAVYGTLYFGMPEQPENLLWLAVYNLSSLTFEKCKALQGRDVYLFPDLSKDGTAFQLWSIKAKEFSERLPSTKFVVSDLLETIAPFELKIQGGDIADVLTGLDWEQVRRLCQKPMWKAKEPEPEKHEKYEAPEDNFISTIAAIPTAIQPLIKRQSPELSNHFTKHQQLKLENWEQEIRELENYFTEVALPQKPVKLSPSTTIKNVSLFLQTHFAAVKAKNGKRSFLPYLHRIKELKEYLSQTVIK